MRIQSVVESHDLTPRNHSRVLMEVNRIVGERHRRKRLVKHFRRNHWTAPGGPYGYTPRSKSTLERKRRKGVDPYRPNFESGRTMAEVVSSSTLTARSKYWLVRARNGSFPLNAARRRELEAISKDEVDADTKLMEKEYASKASQPQFRRKRRRRI